MSVVYLTVYPAHVELLCIVLWSTGSDQL